MLPAGEKGMTLSQLYERGYAIGTGYRVRHIPTGNVYIMANTADYMWAAISLTYGNRWRDPTGFDCGIQTGRVHVEAALGNLSLWERVL